MKIERYTSCHAALKKSCMAGRNIGKTPGEVLIYFSVRGRAAEQGIIFRIPTQGQGIIFVQLGSMTGSIFFIFDSERSF